MQLVVERHCKTVKTILSLKSRIETYLMFAIIYSILSRFSRAAFVTTFHNAAFVTTFHNDASWCNDLTAATIMCRTFNFLQKNIGQTRHLFVYLCPFSQYNDKRVLIFLLKHRWCAWGSNLGLQDGMRRRIYWTMVPEL